MWVDDCVSLVTIEAIALQELMQEECIKKEVLEEAASKHFTAN